MTRRIWIFNHYAGFTETVPASRTFEISRELVRLGWDVTVIASGFNHYTFVDDWGTYPANGRLEKLRDGVRWVFLRTPPYPANGSKRLLNMMAYAQGAMAWASSQADAPAVVIGTTVHPLAVAAAQAISRSRGAKFVYEITDLWPETLVDLGATTRDSWTYSVLSEIERSAFADADGVIGLLPGVADYAREAHGITVKSFLYAPNGMLRGSAERMGTGEVVTGRVVYIGGFAVAHGMDVIPETAAYLEARYPGVFQLELYGDGPERPRLAARVAELGLRNVAFPGFVAKAAARDVLATAECCICTGKSMPIHRYGVSFNKLFDYFAAARPVVFAVDSGNDPVSEAGAGLSVRADRPAALGAAIATIHKLTSEQRAEMGAAGRRFLLSEHVFDVIADRVSRFLSKLLES